MSIVFFLCSILSLLYFLVIVIYSGIDTDFCGIWVLAALFFALLGFITLSEKKHRDEMPRRFPVAVYTSFALFAGVLLVLFGLVHRNAEQTAPDGCDYLIVEGERVYDNGISRILKGRLDKALEYAEKNPGTVLVLSGGTDEGDLFPESLAMYNYMVQKGFPENRLVMESDSETTAESIQNSLELIRVDQMRRMVPPPIMIGVVTSEYHILRTRRIAEKLSSEPLYYLSADSDPVLFVHETVRECFALIKDYVVGNL